MTAKPVPGWSRYRVSDTGRVFGHRGEMKPKTNTRGYPTVTLRDNGRNWTVKVARLVLEAFVGPADGRLVRHLNDVKTDSRLVNLTYGTHADNAEDARRNGRLCIGETHGMTKYTPEQVRRVRELRRLGQTYREIESATGVNRVTAHAIVCNRFRRNVA